MAGKSVSIDELRAMMKKNEFEDFQECTLGLLEERGRCKKFQMQFLSWNRFDTLFKSVENDDGDVKVSFNYYWNEALYYALNEDSKRMEAILDRWNGMRMMVNWNESSKKISDEYVEICRDFRMGYNASQIAEKYAITPEYARQIKRRYKDRV